MNQEFLLSADNINPTINSGGKKHAVNSHSTTENEDHPAFSEELDKHVDRQDSTDKTATSDVKHPQSSEKKADNKNHQQAEELDSKNGNTLPDEQLTAEEAEQTIENVIVLGDEKELGAQLIESTQNPAVVSQVKESLAKTPDAAMADTNKNHEKLLVSDHVNMVKQNTDGSEQNKQQSEAPKIRPDILQALSARAAGKDVENNSIKGDVKTLLTGKQLADKKPVFKELQLTELVKAMVPNKVQQVGQLVDRTGNTTTTAFVNTVMTSVTETVARTEVPSLDIQPAVQTKAWNRVLSGRVIWMAREGIQQATLKLNPANLGPVEVKLTMQDDRVHVTFVAQHAATRDALEQALPRLRESFIENGLEYADADVLQHDFEQADNSQADNGSVNIETEQSVLSDSEIDNEQVVATEQDIEVGVSLYA